MTYNPQPDTFICVVEAGSFREICSMWIFYAIGSSFFAGITAVLAKCGIKKTDSDVATAIRTEVVLLFSWLMVLVTGKQKEIKAIEKKEFCCICLSGQATGASWLCYYWALQEGPASVVVPIDKLSMLVTILRNAEIEHPLNISSSFYTKID